MIDNGLKLNPPDEAFKTAIEPWFLEHFPLAEKTEAQGKEASVQFVQTAKFLGEDDNSLKKKPSNDFFKDMGTFFKSMNTVKDQEKAKRERMAKAAAAKK